MKQKYFLVKRFCFCFFTSLTIGWCDNLYFCKSRQRDFYTQKGLDLYHIGLVKIGLPVVVFSLVLCVSSPAYKSRVYRSHCPGRSGSGAAGWDNPASRRGCRKGASWQQIWTTSGSSHLNVITSSHRYGELLIIWSTIFTTMMSGAY